VRSSLVSLSIARCGCISAEFDGLDDDDLEYGLALGIGPQLFSKILKRLQDACAEYCGPAVFQASLLAAVTPSDFVTIAICYKPPNTASNRYWELRASATPHNQVRKHLQNTDDQTSKDTGNLLPISAGKHHFALSVLEEISHLSLQYFNFLRTRTRIRCSHTPEAPRNSKKHPYPPACHQLYKKQRNTLKLS
jgi:hypothetical protein